MIIAIVFSCFFICCLLFKMSTWLKYVERHVKQMVNERKTKITEDGGGQTDIAETERLAPAVLSPLATLLPLLFTQPASDVFKDMLLYGAAFFSCMNPPPPEKTVTDIEISDFRRRKPASTKDSV